MSANLIVDLGGTCDMRVSVAPAQGVGNTPASGPLFGEVIDLLHADSYCNLVVFGPPNSGPLAVRVQVSDSPLSGSFTDPTSGLPASAFPAGFLSGGVAWFNSGLVASGNRSVSAPVDNAPIFCSGGAQAKAFIRTGRYVRAIALSGTFTAIPYVAFLSQKKTTGSGGGQTQSPGSGVVNV